jgi:hypothetical protein
MYVTVYIYGPVYSLVLQIFVLVPKLLSVFTTETLVIRVVDLQDASTQYSFLYFYFSIYLGSHIFSTLLQFLYNSHKETSFKFFIY